MNTKDIDLDAPAFTRDEENSGTVVAPTVDSQSQGGEGKENGPVTSGTQAQPVVEEQHVPYSRFSTALQRAKDAELEAATAQARYEELQRQQREQSQFRQPEREPTEDSVYRGNLPSYWVKLYGDSDASREAYSYELERQQEVEQRAEQRALDAVDERRNTEERALNTNLTTIDDRLQDLSNTLQRDLTPQEEDAVLDIVDEYTPKDEEGNYLGGDTIPFDKAWEIHILRSESQNQNNRQNRSQATAATSTKSEGNTATGTKSYEDWNPRDWNAYQKRL